MICRCGVRSSNLNYYPFGNSPALVSTRAVELENSLACIKSTTPIAAPRDSLMTTSFFFILLNFPSSLFPSSFSLLFPPRRLSSSVPSNPLFPTFLHPSISSNSPLRRRRDFHSIDANGGGHLPPGIWISNIVTSTVTITTQTSRLGRRRGRERVDGRARRGPTTTRPIPLPRRQTTVRPLRPPPPVPTVRVF